MNQINKSQHNWISVILCFLSVFIIIVFILGSVIPFFQMQSFWRTLKNNNIDRLTSEGFLTKPFTIAQKNISETYFKMLPENTNLKPKDFVALLDKTILSLENYIEHKPYYVQPYLLLGQTYTLKGQILGDFQYILNADQINQKALALSPNHQETLLATALNFALQKKYNESFDLFDKVFSSRIDIGENNRGLFIAALQRLLIYYYHQNNQDQFIKVATWLSGIDTEQKDLYLETLDFIKKNNKFPILEFDVEE